jgi:CHAT domain-containing protein
MNQYSVRIFFAILLIFGWADILSAATFKVSYSEVLDKDFTRIFEAFINRQTATWQQNIVVESRKTKVDQITGEINEQTQQYLNSLCIKKQLEPPTLSLPLRLRFEQNRNLKKVDQPSLSAKLKVNDFIAEDEALSSPHDLPLGTTCIDLINDSNQYFLVQGADVAQGNQSQSDSVEKKTITEINVLKEQRRVINAKPVYELSDELRTKAIELIDEKIASEEEKLKSTINPNERDLTELAKVSGIDKVIIPLFQRGLDKDVTLLFYSITPDTATAFIVTQKTYKSFPLPANEKEIRNRIYNFIDHPSLGTLPTKAQNELYSLLISADLKSYLNTPSIGIVPKGVLQYLPFAALTPDPNGLEYPFDNKALFYLPNAQLLPQIKLGHKTNRASLLVTAPSIVAGLPTLQNGEEAQDIAKRYGAKLLTGSDATKSAFLALASQYSILHIATHSECDRKNPSLSGIFLANTKDGDVYLRVDDIRKLNLSEAELVVLSACETKSCAEYKADEINTLNDAFISAGAPTVIASIWKVEDKATIFLMTRFYFYYLEKGMSKAAALSAAQVDTRKEYKHPFYWAAFVLTGDPGTITSAK